MKKWILISFSVLAVTIVILLIAGLSNLGPLIKKAVNTYGPTITGTEVRLGDAGISLLSAQVKLKDLYLGNPGGFKSPYALKVSSIYLDANERSLTGGTVIIDRIELVHPDIVYEKVRGTDNFQTILDNMKSTGEARPAPSGEPGKAGSGRKIMIRDFIVRGGEVHLAISVPGTRNIQASATLPEVHLKNIGGEEGGQSPTEVFKQILSALYGTITSPSVISTLSGEIKETGTALETLAGSSKKELKETTGKIKGLFGR